jgi:lipoprotein-anchoring transpeptidase ErfK/SrfK
MPELTGSAETRRIQAFIAVSAVSILALCPIGALAQSAAAATDIARRTVLVSLPDRKLAVIENGEVIAQFDVAVGADASPSPTGEFQIVNRVANPAYYHAGTVVPSGKGNPVGTRWLGLSLKGYGIHGTNAPRSIGHAASHGCIRLRNRDMEQLFTMIGVGDVVQIRSERDDEIAQIFGGDDDDEVAEVAQADQAQSK